VPLDEVSPETGGEGGRSLDVHQVAGVERPEVRAIEGLRRDVERDGIGLESDRREAHAVDRERIADRGVRCGERTPHDDPSAVP
jgi:hypothetical protein